MDRVLRALVDQETRHGPTFARIEEVDADGAGIPRVVTVHGPDGRVLERVIAQEPAEREPARRNARDSARAASIWHLWNEYRRGGARRARVVAALERALTQAVREH